MTISGWNQSFQSLNLIEIQILHAGHTSQSCQKCELDWYWLAYNIKQFYASHEIICKSEF